MKTIQHTYRRKRFSFLIVLPSFVLLLLTTASTQAQTTQIAPIDETTTTVVALPTPTPIPVCRIVKADVVALDQVLM